MPPEEGDEVAVDLGEALHHLVFELRGAQGQVIRPLFLDVRALDQEVIEVERDDDEGDQEAENAEEATDAGLDDVEGVPGQCRKSVFDPLAGEEGLKIEVGKNVIDVGLDRIGRRLGGL